MLKDKQRCSYRALESLLRDSPSWRAVLGLTKTPDHNTLWRAAQFLLKKGHTERLLDTVARWAVRRRLLGVRRKPLVVDTTYFESRPVSRHYERRCCQRRRASARRTRRPRRRSAASGNRQRAQTMRGLPKLALAASGYSPLILALQTATGVGGDQPHGPKLLADLRRRVPYRHVKVAADTGFDRDRAHVLARKPHHLVSLIPAENGYQVRAPQVPPQNVYRRRMYYQLATPQGRKACGYSQRSQAETVYSMIKRNLGSATCGKTAHSRKRDLHLKVITHNVMILPKRIETEPVALGTDGEGEGGGGGKAIRQGRPRGTSFYRKLV